MRTSDCDILFVPGLGNSGPDHWQTRWQSKLKTARRVEQADWEAPSRTRWEAAVIEAAAGSSRPVVIVAHSLGVIAVAHAARALGAERIAGAFLVAMPDVEREAGLPEVTRDFAPLPREPLPFPSLLVASRTDPWCAYERAEDFGFSWGSAMVDAGDAGHLNSASGHGPWPEGLMRFAGFLQMLRAP